MPLSDRKVKQAKPEPKTDPKDYKLSDGEGMYLLVKANGSKYWRLKYRIQGKDKRIEKTLALGVYPDVSLKEARDKRTDARRLIAKGIDPSKVKKDEKQAKKIKVGNAFEVIARDWWEKKLKKRCSEYHANRVLKSLETDIFPAFGNTPITDITPQEILIAIREVEERGALDTAQRLLQRTAKIFAYAVATGRAKVNPVRELEDVLEERKAKHQPSLKPAELPAFLKKLSGYTGMIQTRLAFRLLILTFVRPGELRGAKWSEFDFDAKEWRIPAARMKMNTEHIVPLSRQAIKILKELKPYTGQYELLFPNERKRTKPMSENTLLHCIYRMGYKGRASAHGFRASASSVLNEQNFNRDAIERQLSHMERNQVRGAYTHHAEYLKERKKIMQWWANYLDDREHGTNADSTLKCNVDVKKDFMWCF